MREKVPKQTRAELAEIARRQAKDAAAAELARIEGLIRTQNPYDRPVGARTAIPPGPWDRRPEEGREAYLAFDLYRRMRPVERSLNEVDRVLYRRDDRDYESRRSLEVEAQDEGQDQAEEGGGDFGEGRIGFLDDQNLPCEQPKKRSKRQAAFHIRQWAVQFEWSDRARAWDDFVYQQEREMELARRREESIASSHQRRMIRDMFLKIHVAMLQRILDAMVSGVPWQPKDLRDLTLAAERQGLVRDNAYQGVRDLLEDDGVDQSALPVEVAARLHEAMVELAGGPMPALPSPGSSGDVIDVESEPA